MPGCIDGCYLYEEIHSILELPPEKQIELEKEWKKFKMGHGADLGKFSSSINKFCMAGLLKKENELKTKCRYYKKTVESLTSEQRLSLFEKAKDRFWVKATVFSTIIGIIVTVLLSFLNYQSNH